MSPEQAAEIVSLLQDIRFTLMVLLALVVIVLLDKR